MFEPRSTVIDAFANYLAHALRRQFPDCDPALGATLERAARHALTRIEGTDCQYHDLEHTVLVTDAGVAILSGRQLAANDLSVSDWLHAVIAMLFHDIGYLRGLLPSDSAGRYLADREGRYVETRSNATDAALTPYHVDRGRLYVHDVFDADPHVDPERLSTLIEMTRFPVPRAADYQSGDSLAGLVRAADLIGQMGDPHYPVKHARLFAEFQETGETDRLGVSNPDQLRENFPGFFYQQVFPYVTSALRYLDLTDDGRVWYANLSSHVHGDRETLRARVAAA